MQSSIIHKFEKSFYHVFHNYHEGNSPQPYKSQLHIKSFELFILFLFDLRYEKQFSFHQNVEKVFSYTNDGQSFPVGTNVNELTLTNKIMSNDRDDQKQFVLITMLLCLYVPIFCLCQFHFS